MALQDENGKAVTLAELARQDGGAVAVVDVVPGDLPADQRQFRGRGPRRT